MKRREGETHWTQINADVKSKEKKQATRFTAPAKQIVAHPCRYERGQGFSQIGAKDKSEKRQEATLIVRSRKFGVRSMGEKKEGKTRSNDYY